jgi:hypothetical protein
LSRNQLGGWNERLRKQQKAIAIQDLVAKTRRRREVPGVLDLYRNHRECGGMSESFNEYLAPRRPKVEREYRQSERDRRNAEARRKIEVMREQLEIENKHKEIWE